MTALAIHRDQTKAGSAGAGLAPWRIERCRPTSGHHREFPAAHMTTSSRSRRQLGGGSGLHRFSLGWCGPVNAITAVRTRILAGIDERLAALLEADNSQHPGTLQSFPDADPTHFHPSLREPVSDAKNGIGKDFTCGTEPLSELRKGYD